ncbi:ferric-chelate reductase 1-like [Glandiceps talaboti]
MSNKELLLGSIFILLIFLQTISGLNQADNRRHDLCKKFGDTTRRMKTEISRKLFNDSCHLALSSSEYGHGESIEVNFSCKRLDTKDLKYVKVETIARTRGSYSHRRRLQGSFTSASKTNAITKCDDGYIQEIYRKPSDADLLTNVTWHSPWKTGNDCNTANLTILLRATLYDTNLQPVLSSSKEVMHTHSLKRVPRGDHENFRPISVDSCGISKNCYRYGDPKCTSGTCKYLVTYRSVGDSVEFELSAKTRGWAAIGFSSDRYMGGDDVYACVLTNGMSKRIVVKRYLNHGNWPSQQAFNPVNDTEGRIHDGILSCRFRRPKRVAHDDTVTDLDNTWFYLYAWGPATSGSIGPHYMKTPPRSKIELTVSSINLRDDVGKSPRQYSTSPCTVLLATLISIFIKYYN